MDFFIKNDILDVDAIGSATEKNISTYIIWVRVIKAVTQKIINFLAQIENFQKKLFEKKKFVLQDEYCLTLDRIPEKSRENILNLVLNNTNQLEEWENLYNEKISEKEDLYLNDSNLFDEKSFKKLVIDIRHYDQVFKEELLAAFDNLEEEIEGLMINSENFQALNLMLEKYKGKVKCIYTDPPYNTGGDDFVCKDNYQHSSWLTMMENRLELAKRLLANDVKNIIKSVIDKQCIVMDFFAGSGTNGHACLDINREDEGKRKYIQVELGDYFYTTMLPRIKKVMYSKGWKDGKSQDIDGYSHFFK